jgi:hypothetical protein
MVVIIVVVYESRTTLCVSMNLNMIIRFTTLGEKTIIHEDKIIISVIYSISYAKTLKLVQH